MKHEAWYVGFVVGAVALGAGVAGASMYTGRAVTSRLSQQAAAFSKLLPQLRVKEIITKPLNMFELFHESPSHLSYIYNTRFFGPAGAREWRENA